MNETTKPPRDPFQARGLTPQSYRQEWFRYYSGKRITHQWFQVHLLKDLPIERVLEIGPGLGLVTAMLRHAGFTVTTLDRLAPLDGGAGGPFIEADLREVPVDRLAGFDAILCCETLEHLPWHAVDGVFAKFRDSGVRYVVISVPYGGLQLDLRLYLNPFKAAQSFAFRKLKFLTRFREDDADPHGHKWEVGYRGTGLSALEAKLRAAGFAIRTRDFTSPTRSVFFVLENGGGS